MIPSFENRHSLGGRACPMGGGGGSSSSSAATTTTTQNTDKRMVLDGGSIGISSDGGNVNLTATTTDQGSVNMAGQVALSALSTNATNIDHLFTVADHLLSQQQNSLDANVKLTSSLATTAASAYSDAANQASGNKQLIMAAMAVVGVVAFTSLKK